MGTHSCDQAPGQLHREGELGIAHGKRPFQTSRLLEVTIRLARRDGTVSNHLFDSIGQMLELSQQLAGEIETLGFLGIAGAAHMS